MVRDPSVLFFALVFPALLLTVLGLVMPWADEPYDETDPLLAAVTAITGYTPIVLSLAVATVAVSTFPAIIATYRQRGVLRRLSTTPVGPARLLVAQVVVNLVALLVAAALAVASGVLLLDISLPEQRRLHRRKVAVETAAIPTIKPDPPRRFRLRPSPRRPRPRPRH